MIPTPGARPAADAAQAALLWRRGVADPPGDMPVYASDVLCDQVRTLWAEEAVALGLVNPAPIAVQWRWSALAVTGPVEEAVGNPSHSQRFSPLPDVPRVAASMLNEGGLRELFGVYGGLEPGRLILLGGGGTGKSGAAIRLLLDAVSHREGYDESIRARIPVPVLLALNGWDPYVDSLISWLVE
jgi:hypothetical protein